jgi:hypothetical protein
MEKNETKILCEILGIYREIYSKIPINSGFTAKNVEKNGKT